MASIQPYHVAIEPSKLDLLQQKLSLTSLPDELDEAAWDYGAPLDDIKHLVQYWKEKFDWRAQEAKINTLPNFHTEIAVDGFESLDIHFVHQRSNVKGAIPLLFCHGWPGSFLEVTKILNLLTHPSSPSQPAFHVVAPSLPNFGFSAGTKKKGFGLAQYAETCHQLMLRLGYTEYVTQGGDWGTMITRIMALIHPEAVQAHHINMPRGHRPKLTSNPLLWLQHNLSPTTAAEKAGFERGRWFLEQGSGYRNEQATKPQTLGYALADSPVGLLAWIYEKLHDWTDGYPWTEDEILTWISVYLFSTAGPAASVRIYYESMHDPVYGMGRTELHVPRVKLGVSYFPKELSVVPKTWGRTMGPVVFEGHHSKGGHFAAYERPEDLVNDLRAMFGRNGGAEGVVRGASGYGAVIDETVKPRL